MDGEGKNNLVSSGERTIPTARFPGRSDRRTSIHVQKVILFRTAIPSAAGAKVSMGVGRADSDGQVYRSGGAERA